MQVNAVWEASVMNGWTRPTPLSPPERKAEWIVAKYAWFAFVEVSPLTRESVVARVVQGLGGVCINVAGESCVGVEG